MSGSADRGIDGAANADANDEVASLAELLRAVAEWAGPTFCGVGLILCDRPGRLPIIPIRPEPPADLPDDLVAALARISVPASEYHDGFHVVGSDGRLLRAAHYFSPPIVPGVAIDRSKLFGGRYLAALFGSALDPVRLTGIASREFGIAVFADGAEHHYEPAR